MKISDVKPILTASMEAKDSIIMTGVHGIGKSEVVKEWAEENDIALEILYLSSNEVGDLIGVPYNKVVDGRQIESWSVPSWLDNLHQTSKQGKKCALFLDEISRAALDVRQASLQLVLDKKIHQHKLPENTLVVAADNPDNGLYQVEAMDPALLDRFLAIDVEVDVEGWLKWARGKKVNPIVRDFIAENPKKLHFIPNEGADCNISATPRSWTKLASYIDNIDNIPKAVHYQIIKGKIGTALAAQFLNFIQNYSKMVSVEDIEDLTSKLLKSTKDIEKIGEGIRELIKDTEVVQKEELLITLINKYTQKTAEESYPMLGTLYALDFENLAGILKKYQTNENEKYLKIQQN